MDIRKGYKVVGRDDADRFISALGEASLNEQGMDTVVYKINKWTRPFPGCGPLAVFDSLELARPFALGSHLFQCEYVQSAEYTLWYFDQNSEGRTIKIEKMTPNLPGTVLADKVKLLEEIREELG